MLKTRLICAAAMTAVLLAGCSTRPRNFAASVSTPVADRAAFENDYRTCQELVMSGHTSNFKGAAVSALAGGAGFFGAGSALYSAGAMGVSGGAGAVSMAVPFIGPLVGFGVSRAIRSGKEGKLKRNMTACLGEYGYSVAEWEKLPKKADAARVAADRSTLSASSSTAAEQQAESQPSRPLKSS